MAVRACLLALLVAMSSLVAPGARGDVCGDAVVPGSVQEITGFDRAESAFWDEDSGAFYISNIGPTAAGTDPASARDGNGYLSRMLPGEPHERHWVGGPLAPADQRLSSPKGIRIRDGKLYVADIDQVAVVDIAQGKVVDRIAVEGAVVLNDPAIKGNDLFVSDFRRLTVWRIDLLGRDAPDVFVGPDVLGAYGQPNGVLIRAGRLWVGTVPSAAATGGYLLEIDAATGELLAAHGEGKLGRIDGLESYGTSFLLTDNGAGTKPGRLVRFDPADGSATDLVSSQLRGTTYTRYADIGLRRDDCTVVIPHLDSRISAESADHFVTVLRLEKATGD